MTTSKKTDRFLDIVFGGIGFALVAYFGKFKHYQPSTRIWASLGFGMVVASLVAFVKILLKPTTDRWKANARARRAERNKVQDRF